MKFSKFSAVVLFSAACCVLPLAAQPAQIATPFGNLPTLSARDSQLLKRAEAAESAREKIEILEDAVESSRAVDAAAFALGNAYFSLGEYEKAAAAYEKSLAKLPNFFAARKNLAYARDALGDSEGARKNFLAALALSGGSDSDILFKLAEGYAKAEDWSAALDCINRAILYSSGENPAAQYARAYYLFKIGRFAESAAACGRVLARNRADSAALCLLGNCRSRLGDFAGAYSAFSQVPADSPQFGAAQIARADILFSQKCYARAAEIYLERGEKSRAVRAAQAAALSGDFHTAQSLAAKLPDSPEKRNILARAYIGLGDAAAARKILSEILAENPSDAFACFESAEIAFAEKNYNLAKILYKRAESDEKYFNAARFGSAKTCVKTGDFAQAIALVRSLRASNPELAQYIEYLKNAENGGHF